MFFIYTSGEDPSAKFSVILPSLKNLALKANNSYAIEPKVIQKTIHISI